MLYQQNNTNIISMNQGDSGSITFDINLGTTANPDLYTLTANDYVYFGIMTANQSFENPTIAKKGQNTGETEITFNLLYQETMKLIPGTYYYVVKLKRLVGLTYQIDTIIPRTKFIVTGETSFKGENAYTNPFEEYDNPKTYTYPNNNVNDVAKLVIGGTNPFAITYGLPKSLIKDVQWMFSKGLCKNHIVHYLNDITITEYEDKSGDYVVIETTLADYESENFKSSDEVNMQLKITLTTGSVLYGEVIPVTVISSLN